MTVEISGWITGSSVFDAVPKSAEAIAGVIGAAASIEAEWVSILATLTHAEVDASVALWRSLRGAQAQERAMLEIAEMKLETDEVALLRKVMKRLETHRKTRDRFAHGVWAVAFGLDDRLILLTGKALARISARVFGDGEFANLTLPIEERDIFRAEQFQQALKEAERARDAIAALASYLHLTSKFPSKDRRVSLKLTSEHIDQLWSS